MKKIDLKQIDVNEFLNLPKFDDISFDISYVEMPLSLFCKKLGVTEDDFLEALQ